jgi:hypothetical protein
MRGTPCGMTATLPLATAWKLPIAFRLAGLITTTLSTALARWKRL